MLADRSVIVTSSNDEIEILANPDLVAQMPYNLRSAVFFWLNKNCWKKADGGMNDAAIDAVTKIVNGGEIKKNNAGAYNKDPKNNPVLLRRKFAKLAYAAFT